MFRLIEGFLILLLCVSLTLASESSLSTEGEGENVKSKICRLYVAMSGSDEEENSCSTQETPCRTVQYALNQVFDNKTCTVEIDNSVVFQWPALTVTVAGNVTIRSSDPLGEVFIEPAPEHTYTSSPLSVTSASVDSHISLENLHFRYFQTVLSTGGVLHSQGCSSCATFVYLTATNLTFTNNTCNPAASQSLCHTAYASYYTKSAHFRGCVFDSNRNSINWDGATLGAQSSSGDMITVEDSIFVNNVGRGMGVWMSSYNIVRSIFIGNSMTQHAGTGGGLYVYGGMSRKQTGSVSDCWFEGNSARDGGGALRASYGDQSMGFPILFSNNVFIGNDVSASRCDSVWRNNTFTQSVTRLAFAHLQAPSPGRTHPDNIFLNNPAGGLRTFSGQWPNNLFYESSVDGDSSEPTDFFHVCRVDDTAQCASGTASAVKTDSSTGEVSSYCYGTADGNCACNRQGTCPYPGVCWYNGCRGAPTPKPNPRPTDDTATDDSSSTNDSSSDALSPGKKALLIYYIKRLVFWVSFSFFMGLGTWIGVKARREGWCKGIIPDRFLAKSDADYEAVLDEEENEDEDGEPDAPALDPEVTLEGVGNELV